MNAARLEQQGQRFFKTNGQPWNHIEEVRNGQSALGNRIVQVKGILSNPNLSVGEQLYYGRELSSLSKYLDYTRGFLP